MIKSAAEIIEAAKRLSIGKKRRVAVAVAQDADVLGAVRSACDDGLCDAILIGDQSKIASLADTGGLSLDGFEITNLPNPHQAVMEAARLASEGQADVIMKGFVATSELLKGVLDRRFNLRAGPTLSHVAVLDIPGYHKLLMLTDGGMVVKPTLEQRLEIVRNALLVGHALGIETVKVALSAAADSATEAMPQTVEDARIVEIIQKEGWAGCLAAGPISFDAATSRKAAEKAGLSHPVAGDADAYVVGSIEECNITAKSMIVFAGAVFSGVIVGAKVPVSLVSRTDPAYGKKVSLALAFLVAEYLRRPLQQGG